MNALIKTHNEISLSPVDKANVNVAFICQLVYALVLIKELALDGNSAGINETCIQVNQKTNNQLIIANHTTFLWDIFNLQVGKEN